MKLNFNSYIIIGLYLVLAFTNTYFRILGKWEEILENNLYYTAYIIGNLLIVILLVLQIFLDIKNKYLYILFLIPYSIYVAFIINNKLEIGILELVLTIIWIPIAFIFFALRVLWLDIDNDEKQRLK